MALSQQASDPRFSLWGNLGFLYRFTLFLLEKRHRIYNLHACALYEPSQRRLYVIVGGAGSGKSVYLLAGLERGLALFSTETLHFRHEGRNVRWFMGSLADNIRVATLRQHFPRFLPAEMGGPREDDRSRKIVIDLSSYRHSEKTLIDPDCFLIFPRIEEGFEETVIRPLGDTRESSQALFANVSEKLSQTTILYDRVPVPGFDSARLAEGRLAACRCLAQHKATVFCGAVLSSPRNCWGDLIERKLPRRRKS